MLVLVMGVSGSGKSTVARDLARILAWPFVEADDYHEAGNREKMHAGVPLTEADRAPWLHAVRAATLGALAQGDGQGVVLACSALREAHRTVLLSDLPCPWRIIFLHGGAPLLRERLLARQHPFMTAALLGDQLATLEPPSGSHVLSLDVACPEAELVADACRWLR